VVVDGGNSKFQESVRRAEETDAAYLDCGTSSGGPASAEEGFSLMIGGPEWAYEALVPIFDAVATGPAGHDRMGESGSGHYVKMVHNGVEYALMQAYGEGFELLTEGRYDLDMESVARTWNNGAVIRSWLLELCEEAFHEEGSDLGRRRPRRRRVHRDVDGSGGARTGGPGPDHLSGARGAVRLPKRGASRGGSRTGYGTDSGATRSRGARTRSETGRRGELSQVRAHFR